MNPKFKLPLIIAGSVVLIILIGLLGRVLYMHHRISPGMEGLSKLNVGVLYCTHNDNIPTLVGMIKKRLNAKTFEIANASPYPKNEAEFKNRVREEGKDVSKVAVDAPSIDLQKFDFLVIASPVMEDRPCPALQRYIIDNHREFKDIPVSVLVTYKANEVPANTQLFFKRKLYAGIWKPPFVTKSTDMKKLNREFDLWFNLMEFERYELKK